MRTLALVLTICLVVPACSDDSGGKTDGGPTPDSIVAQDTATSDQPTAPTDGTTQDHAAAGDAAAADGASGDASKKAFGETCTDNAECESGLCHKFGDGTQACTQSCSSDAECPSGSQGQKCNNQNVCRV